MKHTIRAAILAASALGLSACVTDGGYGYTGVSLGYGSGYGDPYWGWYDDFYYPGTGYYIYDHGGRRHRWNDSQRRYWEARRGNRPVRQNWSGFRRDGNTGAPAWRGREGQRPQGQRPESQRPESQRPGRQGLTDAQRQSRREAWQSRRQQSGQAAQPRRERQGDAPSWRGRGNRTQQQQ